MKPTVSKKQKMVFFKAPDPPFEQMKNLAPHRRLWRLLRKADLRNLGWESATGRGPPDELGSFLSTPRHRGCGLSGLLIRRQRKVQSLTDFEINFLANIGVVAQELPGVLAALPDSFGAE